MPISRDQLEIQAKPLDERILQLLQSRPDQAFDLLEIFAMVEGYSAEQVHAVFRVWDEEEIDNYVRPHSDCLVKLIEKDKITSAQYQGRPYFAVK